MSTLPFEGLLLVSDMDRTLVTEKFTVPKRNLEAIDRFIGGGGRFALATGRVASSAAKYLGRVSINAPSILSNGASIYDFNTEKILWNTTLAPTAKTIVAKVLEKFPDVGAEIYKDEQIYIVGSNEWTERHIVNEGFNYRATDLESVPAGWQKLLFADENSRLCEVEDFIRSVGYSDCDFVFSNTMYFEGIPKGISKGTALLRLAEMLGIAHKNTVGIGDYYNDVSLVRSAGIGATVAGAPEELVDLAEFVAGPCADGAVADLVDYLERVHSQKN